MDLKAKPEPYNSVNLKNYCDFGWFDEYREVPLGQLLREEQPKKVCEIGSWMGKSTRFIAQTIADDGVVVAVDTWKGTLIEEHIPEVIDGLYDQFLSNVIHAGLCDKIRPIRMESHLAAAHLSE